MAIRQVVPTGENVFGLQLGFFASYIFLFALGIAAWRNDWLKKLSGKNARPWLITLVVAWPCLPAGIAVAVASGGLKTSNFSGGLSWTAILYDFWEPFVAWGLIALWLPVFREWMNQPSGLWSWLNRRAYAVYIIHPLVLKKIAAVDRVFEVLRFAVAQLPGEIVDAVDAALRTTTVRSLQPRQAHDADVAFQFGQFHGGRRSGQPAADDRHARSHQGILGSRAPDRA